MKVILDIYIFINHQVLLKVLIIHVIISKEHAQWQWHFSISIQQSCWWPMLILVLLLFAKTSLLFLFLAESVKILVGPRRQEQTLCSKRSAKVIWIAASIVVQTGIYIRDVFSWKLKSMDGLFTLKLDNYVNLCC